MDIYLDNNATTQPLPEVVEAMGTAMGAKFGNPSSPHRHGTRAKELLEATRVQIARLVGAEESSVFFTSGGTEANNIVLQTLLQASKSKLLLSVVEHSSVQSTAEQLKAAGTGVEALPVDKYGVVPSETLTEALRRSKCSLVSIQWANSETGTIQPIRELGEICRDNGVLFHVDAAQAVGRIPVNFNEEPINFLTFTAHKIHGPQGIGAVCVKSPNGLRPLMFGGEQEREIRPGTENMPGVVGFGTAALLREKSLSEAASHMTECRDLFERIVLGEFPEISINGDTERRVANTSNLLFAHVDGMAMMAQLDIVGISCSMTSACVTSRPEPSYVLRAMGLSEAEAYASLRFSFSVLNTKEEAQKAAMAVCGVYRKLLTFQEVQAQQ